jgi:hypothetical protein
MKIVIPDDYQDMVDQLECFSLIAITISYAIASRHAI